MAGVGLCRRIVLWVRIGLGEGAVCGGVALWEGSPCGVGQVHKGGNPCGGGRPRMGAVPVRRVGSLGAALPLDGLGLVGGRGPCGVSAEGAVRRRVPQSEGAFGRFSFTQAPISSLQPRRPERGRSRSGGFAVKSYSVHNFYPADEG